MKMTSKAVKAHKFVHFLMIKQSECLEVCAGTTSCSWICGTVRADVILKLESSIQYHSENKCDFYANSQIQGEKPQIWWQRKSIVLILDGCGCIQFSHFGGHCKRMSPKRLLCGDESRCTKEGKVGRWICVNRGGVPLKCSKVQILRILDKYSLHDLANLMKYTIPTYRSEIEESCLHSFFCTMCLVVALVVFDTVPPVSRLKVSFSFKVPASHRPWHPCCKHSDICILLSTTFLNFLTHRLP